MTPQADPPPATPPAAKRARSSTRSRKLTSRSRGAATAGSRRSAAARAHARARATADLPARLRGAEIILAHDIKLAIALHYTPGTTPVVLARGKGQDAENIVWCAQELGIPVVEIPALQPSDLQSFQVGEEIPEASYRPVAHALALLYKSTPGPNVVRFIRPVGGRGRRQQARLKALEQEFGEVLATPPLCVEASTGIMEFAADFRDPIQQLRQRIAAEMGLLLPTIPMRVNHHFNPSDFAIRFRDVPVQSGTIDLPVDSPEKLFLIVNRLKQLIYRSGWELLGFQEVETHLELVRKSHPALVRSLFPAQFSTAALRQILRNLLREQLSIRDLATILEVIAENLAQSQDPDLLTECVRMAYSRSLCAKFQDENGYLNVLLFTPEVERIFHAALRESAGVRWLDLEPDEALRVLRAMDAALKGASSLQFTPVLLTSPLLRRFVSRLVEPIFDSLPVMSYNEIAPLTEVRSIGTINV